jgi:beta propeller repeat protein
MKGKILGITIAIICLICTISAVSAGTVTKIGTGHYPAIYNTKITWADNGGSIHVYDTSTKKDVKISSTKSSHPAIYGNKLVWNDMSSSAPRLTVYDISSGARTYVTQNIDASSVPRIYSNVIVWGAAGNVYMRDISVSKQSMIAVGENPDIYGTKIVYLHDSTDMPQPYVYDISTKKTQAIPANGDYYNAHIYGSKVIWTDYYTRMGWIDMFDLSTKTFTTVTSDGANSGNPNVDCGCDTGYCAHIYNGQIAYAKTTNDCLGKAGVYIYSISTGKSTMIYNSGGAYTTPDIYNNVVVWGIEESSSNSNIYYWK